jgi:hypothetical protein
LGSGYVTAITPALEQLSADFPPSRVKAAHEGDPDLARLKRTMNARKD